MGDDADDNSKYVSKHTLFVRNIPAGTSAEEVREYLSGFGPIRRFFIVGNKTQSNGCHYGFVTYSDQDDAKEAISMSKQKEFKGSRLDLDYSVRLGRKGVENENASHQIQNIIKEQKRKYGNIRHHRLLVRNIPPDAKEDDVKEIFSNIGDIVEICIPRDVDNRIKPIAFIQYRNPEDAERAIATLNGTKLMRKTLRVGFALSKSEYEDRKKTKTFSSKEKLEMGSVDRPLSGESKSIQCLDRVLQDKPTQGVEHKSPISYQDFKDSDETESIGSLHDILSESEGSECDDSDDTHGVDIVEESEADAPVKHDKICNKKSYKEEEMDRTVFVRNLHYLTTEHDLKEILERFGQIKYIKFPKNTSGRVTGNAFVCFENKVSADLCTSSSEQNRQPEGFINDDISNINYHKHKQRLMVDTSNSEWVLKGRWIVAVKAVNRDLAKSLENKTIEDKKKKDTQNVYLLNELGLPSSFSAANGLTKKEYTDSVVSVQKMRKKLKDKRYFVSPTRLSLRRLPKELTEKQIKDTCISYIDKYRKGNRKDVVEKTRVKQVKIVKREGEKTKSAGYGFIEFYRTEDALDCVRAMNNKNVFSKITKIHVEFAIEDSRMLKIREDRIRKIGSGVEKRKKKVLKKEKQSLPY